MHQPSYVRGDEIFLPWVFLHSIKDYYDMARLAEKYGVNVTFNLTPTLIKQLSAYEEDDYFLKLMKKDCKDLTKAEKKYLLKIFKSLNYDTMVKPYDYFSTLFKQNEYTENEFLDLQVWFLLAWCGNYLKSYNETVKKLILKKRFEKKDKLTLIEELKKFVLKIIPYYKKLNDEGVIRITTTPYYHPILPLLIDMGKAKEADTEISLPKGFFPLEEDAEKHIEKSLELFKRTFGKKPEGIWPAEGAVDENSLLLYKKNGVKWIATDEKILKKSGFDDCTKAYEYEGVKIYFRNETLSDLIGFTYRYYDAEYALNDFASRLLKGLNVIILDGENAWEYYPSNGKKFLELFYGRFKENFVFFECEKSESLNRIAPGSWINADFDTWVGDEEKNRAWELLFDTKRDYLRKNVFNAEAEEEFLVSESSDWFWWYGKGHYTEYVKEFDFLFREHLKRIYKLINLPYPKILDIPITGKKELKNLLSRPKDYIYPSIDGRVTSFFEWIDAGVVYESGGSMHQDTQIRYIYWGENEKSFYLRLDGDIKDLDFKVFFEGKELDIKMEKDEIAEIEIDKKEFFKNEGVLRIEVFKNGKIVNVLPSFARLYITVNEDYTKNWYV